jgi:antitoxin component of RelBE/YafQ-DinJ toxin-antitoxin module
MVSKTICIRIDEEDWKKFREFAESIGTTRNRLIKLFVKQFIEKAESELGRTTKREIEVTI